MKRAIFVVALFVVPLLAYFQFIDPDLSARERQMESQIRELDTRIEQARSAQRKLPQFREESARLSAELPKLESILPEKADVEAIRFRLTEDAAFAGVRLVGFEPRPPQPASMNDPYDVIWIDTAVTGDAAHTAVFLKMLASESRILDVARATMRKTPDGWKTYFWMASYVARPKR